MKRINIIIGVVLLLSCIGCAKDSNFIDFNATIEQYESKTKAHISDGNDGTFLCWDKSDSICLNNVQKNIVKKIGPNSKEYQIKDVVAADDGTYTVAYPYFKSISARHGEVSYLEYINYIKGKNFPMVAYATSTNTDLIFRNTSAVLNFSITNGYSSEITIKSIQITALDGTKLSGQATVNAMTSTPVVSYNGTNVKTIKEINIDISPNANSSLYVSVPPTTATNTFGVLIEFMKDGETLRYYRETKSDPNPSTNRVPGHVNRNEYVIFPLTISDNNDYVVSGAMLSGKGTKRNPYLVSSLAELEYVKANFNQRNNPNDDSSQVFSGAHFKQIADISGFSGGLGIMGENSIPFTGVYNGGDHFIILLNSAKSAVFDKVGDALKGATISNVKIKLKDNFPPISITDIANTCVIGSLVNIITDGIGEVSISFCNSTVGFTIQGNSVIVGGLCGEIGNRVVSMSSCIYESAVIVGGAANDVYIGGLCGSYKGESLSFNSVTNSSQLISYSGGYVGGLLGYATNPSTVTDNDCNWGTYNKIGNQQPE